KSEFDALQAINARIKTKLESHADGKSLKGDEIVGGLGEIYGKLLLNGSLLDDSQEPDFVTPDAKRVSVKTRKGRAWRESSAIPKIDGEDCPTHLMLVRLYDDYRVHSIWLYDWEQIRRAERFKVK